MKLIASPTLVASESLAVKQVRPTTTPLVDEVALSSSITKPSTLLESVADIHPLEQQFRAICGVLEQHGTTLKAALSKVMRW